SSGGKPRKKGLRGNARTLEPACIQQLRSEPAIEGEQAGLEWVVEPVLCVDGGEIVGGLWGPTGTGLATPEGAFRVVREVVDPPAPRAELQLGDDPVQTSIEAPLHQLHLIPLGGGVDD